MSDQFDRDSLDRFAWWYLRAFIVLAAASVVLGTVFGFGTSRVFAGAAAVAIVLALVAVVVLERDGSWLNVRSRR